MLTSLLVQNLAVTRECEITFGPGMTVLTGETGAGKSVLVSAIALVLGARADSNLVRRGAAQARVAAEFDVREHPEVCAALAEQGIEHDGLLLIRRQVNADGGSRAYLNDTPVTLKTLTGITTHLVAIHGQHQHYELASREAQRGLLDEYGRHEPLTKAVAEAALRWRDLARELAALQEADAGDGDREGFLRFQVDELEGIAVPAEEVAALDAQHRRLAHGAELVAGCEQALALLEEDTALERIFATLKPLEAFDERIAEARELVTGAGDLLTEAQAVLRRAAEAVEVSPGEFEDIDRRLGALHAAGRKYKVAPDALGELLERLRQELAQLANREARTEELTALLADARSDYDEAAARLREARAAAGRKLAAVVSELIADLGLPDGRFEVALTPRTDESPSVHGSEDVEFRVSTNSGQPPASLARVASGGELSRISLAIQTATASLTGVPVLVYDEVDTGVGGRVAELVGRRLRETAAHRQVICVTHLPQVASLAGRHLSVRKRSSAKAAEVTVLPLTDDARVEELARMLAGVEVSETSLTHAAEMLERAAQSA